ncbi:ArnT family glycosyltransferase [Arthrobacter bambusae]|uniref:4-amino-4-deoxy-L-arabinose transferase-like glycosyltransferase n=1 Tax=Arthrobacter bambusae TaxID=1338426 RepID=A0AAW8DBG2_9MICC|nr:glycosyltransferase family 39 protein [Arthrobacter bambusae]MDP9906236.1 4-amino-4-deoxy-L-arabinose transferase-like glycosyltransferase [Arthrobacter bambusae]MDQ0130531.1 4-amino-4-deoxy-L-arabinose transferase-like glycosyltransferase [Arthrobacter bambusae]MDQ0182206.1 4-amino-4-deoxy-L-arabinose transferase-like glycosyltransferase [Arthrobacter bambusae]
MTTSFSTGTDSEARQPAPPPLLVGPTAPQEAAVPHGGGGRARAGSPRRSRRPRRTRGPHALRHRVELGFVLLATAVLYLWNLGASGWANAFYSAAAQAGSQNWAAWFFGSSDAANSITVDKPPASLWIMDLSVRIFGLSSWSILVPQALMGVATAWLLYLAVRRAAAPASGDPRLAHRAGLLAAVVMAITPVATLMFRFNNPDALLVLLMTAAGYATLRSMQDNTLRWLLLAGVFLGFGFLTKQLQILLVVPGFAVAYLVAAPGGVGRRLLHLLGAGAAMVVAAGWWLAVVELVPANMRPYIGGSQNNSILELTLGYNGLGRLSGQETGSVGGGNGWGVPGLFRMFNNEFGGQIAWLLPSVLVLGAGLLWLGRRAPRTDSVRASVIVWGSWVLVTGLVFSFMAGIIHPYYAVALAPGIAGLAGLGGALLWQHRAQLVAAVVLAVAMAAAGFTAFGLLGGTTAYGPLLRWAALLGALAAAAGLLLSGRFPVRILHRTTAALALAASLAGPLAYSISTASVTHSGAIPSAGPATTFGGFGGFGARGGFGQNNAAQNTPPQTLQQPGAQAGGFGGNRQGGGLGGLLGATTPSSEMVAALKSGASNYTWAAAVVGSNNAAGYQLATELPVMAVGGFNGTDPSPTLEQFQQLVAQGKIHYFIAGGTMQANSGSEAPAQIAQWVAANFQSQTIGGTTVYALAG